MNESVLKEQAASVTLPGTMELCTRLSKKNRTTIKFSIENLTEKEQTANKKLLDLEKLLSEQTIANQELSERVSRLDMAVVTKDTTKKVHMPSRRQRVRPPPR